MNIKNDKNDEMESLERVARRVRREVLKMVHETSSPHIGSSFSAVEILVALFFHVLKTSPERMNDPARDRFILSKGHAAPALYAVLAERGYFDRKELEGFAVDGGIFEQHPNRDVRRGIEVTSGSLGHGLAIGVGMALAGRIDRADYQVHVLLSDGELNEGSVWEAVMFAGHQRLSNLAAYVDANQIQALGHTREVLDLKPIGGKWESFGWHAQEVDGHDFRQIFQAVNNFDGSRPNLVVLNTVKGKGVSFMENNLLWHYRSPDDEEYKLALKELGD